MAVRAQAQHEMIAVDAFDRRLAGRIDSATTTASASLKQVQNSSNSDCSRVKRCGCTTATTLPLVDSRAAFSTAAISTG